MVRYRLDPDQVAEIQDFSLRQGIETIRGRVDKFGVAEPTIIKKGTDIVIELPGLEQRDFERIKSIIGRTAQLQFKIVDRRLGVRQEGGGHRPPGPAASPSSPTPGADEKTGALHEVVFLRAKDRATLEKFVAGLTGELAVPNDREFGYEEVVSQGRGQRRRPSGSGGPTCCTGARASPATTWPTPTSGFTEMGTPNVLFTMNRKGGDLMGKLTGENVGRRMAIVLDEKISSAPEIQSQINERGEITLGAAIDPRGPAAGGQGPGGGAALRLAARPADQDLRDPGGPDAGRRHRPAGDAVRCTSAPPRWCCSCCSTTGWPASSRSSPCS